MTEVLDCDGCNNVIVMDEHQIPQTHSFTLPGDELREYHQFDYRLCVECRQRVIEMFESDDESVPQVDLSFVPHLRSTLQSISDDTEALADKLSELDEQPTDS